MKQKKINVEYWLQFMYIKSFRVYVMQYSDDSKKRIFNVVGYFENKLGSRF